jgi:glycosyltransferase involved in cell wall biosynthesis
MKWHIITAEYPPQFGGVSDYTYQVARELAAVGDEVHVWCPNVPGTEPTQERGDVWDDKSTTSTPGRVTVHRELGTLSPRDLKRVGKLLDRFPVPRRVLIQWVPHGFGLRALNVPFCLWLWRRARNDEAVEIMAHECYLPFKAWALRQNTAALVQRLMTIILLHATRHVWVSTPAWADCWRPLTLGRNVAFTWLPVPSNIPVVNNPEAVAKVRARYARNGELVIGHFGTYSLNDRKTLKVILPLLLAKQPRTVILMGRGSEATRLEILDRNPELRDVLHASGRLLAKQVSLHLSACDVLLQPCQDGVSGRRTTVMAAMAHGRPIVTTSGWQTEPVWSENHIVALARSNDLSSIAMRAERLLNDEHERKRLAKNASQFYRERFEIGHLIARLRSAI